MTRKKSAAVIVSAVVIVGIGGETFGQTRTRRSIEGPVTSESVVRSLSIVPVPEEASASGRVDARPPAGATGLGVDAVLGRPAELSVMLRINFALDSADLTPGARRDLDQVAAALLESTTGRRAGDAGRPYGCHRRCQVQPESLRASRRRRRDISGDAGCEPGKATGSWLRRVSVAA